MSSRSSTTSGRDSKPVRGKDEPAPAPVFRPPLRPWHKVFSILRIVVILWVLLLLFLYLTTVFPHRGKTSASEAHAGLAHLIKHQFP